MSLNIQVEKDTATPWLREMRRRVTPHGLAVQVGPRATRLVQMNFISLGRNAKGWPSTHFYGRTAEATNWQEGFGFVMLVVNQIGIRQRLLGGDIKPVNAGALTIPAAPEAYGKGAGEFHNLQFGFAVNPETGTMMACLKETMATQIRIGQKRKDGSQSVTPISTNLGVKVMYWLAKGVHQEPDPRVLPSEEAFAAEFDKAVEDALRFAN